MLSTTSPARNPAANSARAPRQGSACRPSGSKIGPGEVKRRANDPGAAATKPPKGAEALCRAGSSDLRSTGRPASAALEVTAAGSMPFEPLGIGGRGHRAAQHVRQAGEQLRLAHGRFARLAGVVMGGHGWSFRVGIRCTPPPAWVSDGQCRGVERTRWRTKASLRRTRRRTSSRA